MAEVGSDPIVCGREAYNEGDGGLRKSKPLGKVC